MPIALEITEKINKTAMCSTAVQCTIKCTQVSSFTAKLDLHWFSLCKSSVFRKIETLFMFAVTFYFAGFLVCVQKIIEKII